jgi:hypothetical protein
MNRAQSIVAVMIRIYIYCIHQCNDFGLWTEKSIEPENSLQP